MSLPLKLKNFNLFNEGQNYIGQVTEITLPKLTTKMEEYRAGGMDGPVEVDLGIEKLTLEWTCGGYVKQVLTQFGMLTHNGAGLRFAGALQSEDAESVKAIEVVVRGRHSEIEMETAKMGEDTSLKITTACSYYKLTIDNEVLIEIDLINMIKKVDGKDVLENFRLALGI